MSRWLDIARRAEKNSSSLTDNRQEPAESPPYGGSAPFLPLSAGCREGNLKNLDVSALAAGSEGNVVSLGHARASDARPNRSVGGRTTTWTGRVVSFSDWEVMTQADKYGPNGRLWNGLTKQWEKGG